MKRVLVSGYYGMMNTGDDALLAATCWGVKSFLHSERIWATAPVIPKIYDSERIRAVYVPTPRFLGENGLRAYARALLVDNIVFGGGSVFHTARDMRDKINFLKLAGKGPHAAVGVAVGPFASADDERTCAELLKRLDFVGLRDEESLKIVEGLAPRVRCAKTFDLAPLLLRTAGLSGEMAIPSSSRKGVGLSLCDYESYVGGDKVRESVRREKISLLLDSLDPLIVEELVFIDFNGHHSYGDRKLHQEISGSAAGRFHIRHVPYCPDPLHTLREIAGLRAIVSMRLHAAIFAFLAGTPAVVLSYHPKCLGWANEVGIHSDFVFDSVDFEPDRVANAIIKGVNGEYPNPKLSRDDAIYYALQNWTWVNE